MNRALLLILLLSMGWLLDGCGGCSRYRDVQCPPTDPLHPNFGTCQVCADDD